MTRGVVQVRARTAWSVLWLILLATAVAAQVPAVLPDHPGYPDHSSALVPQPVTEHVAATETETTHGEEESPLAVEHGSWFYPLASAINHAVDPSGHFKLVSGYNFVSLLVLLLLVSAAASATRGLRQGTVTATDTPRGLQNVFETIVDGLGGFFASIIGPHGKRYTPLILTFFMYILFNNWMAVVPGFVAPTSSLNMTVALALTAFCAVQYYAIRANGLKNYLLHFAGEPKDPLGWVLAVLMFPLEVIGEMVKPLSLSLRLFGNVFGEDTVVLQIMGLWLSVAGWRFAHHHLEQSGAWWATVVPVHLPMAAFALFGGLIQALVFSLLVSVYISLLTSHAAHEDETAAAH